MFGGAVPGPYARKVAHLKDGSLLTIPEAMKATGIPEGTISSAMSTGRADQEIVTIDGRAQRLLKLTPHTRAWLAKYRRQAPAGSRPEPVRRRKERTLSHVLEEIAIETTKLQALVREAQEKLGQERGVQALAEAAQQLAR